MRLERQNSKKLKELAVAAKKAVGSRAGNLSNTGAASSELAREINRDVILELIRLQQPVARVDLARSSGLQITTVYSIVEQLLSEGWIREGQALRTARGRRPTHLSLNDDLAMLVADVHFGRATLAVVDLNGRMLESEDVRLSPEVQEGVRDLAEAMKAQRSRHAATVFMGIGVCLPGRVDTETGLLMVAPNLHWQKFDVQAELARQLGMKVELENDANACLLAELWFGRLDGVRNAVLLAISEGVGASILADGHLIRGRLGMAGEFGHICYDPTGPVCGCGRRGCWEMFASSSAALRYYSELAPDAPAIGYPELARRAEGGDGPARGALERQAAAVGRGLLMVTAALDPQTILFAGEISQAWPLIAPVLQKTCEAGILAGTVPQFKCIGNGDMAHLLGAAAVVLQRHASYYRSRSPVRAANAQTARSHQPARKLQPRHK